MADEFCWTCTAYMGYKSSTNIEDDWGTCKLRSDAIATAGGTCPRYTPSPDKLDKLIAIRTELQLRRTKELFQLKEDPNFRCPVCGTSKSSLLKQWFPGTQQRYVFNVDGPDVCGLLVAREVGCDPYLRGTPEVKGPWGSGPCPPGWWENPPEEFKRQVDAAVAKAQALRSVLVVESDGSEIDGVRFRQLEKEKP